MIKIDSFYSLEIYRSEMKQILPNITALDGTSFDLHLFNRSSSSNKSEDLRNQQI